MPPTSSESTCSSATRWSTTSRSQRLCRRQTGSVWKQNNEMADKANEPGKFTAFCAYEWTSTPDNRNMHRNVFFKDCAKVPEAPFSSLESTDPTDLWKWMDEQR